MEFGYFIILFGCIFSGIAYAIYKKGMLTPKNPNCPADIRDAEVNNLSLKILSIIGPITIIAGLLLVILG